MLESESLYRAMFVSQGGNSLSHYSGMSAVLEMDVLGVSEPSTAQMHTIDPFARWLLASLLQGFAG